MQRPLRLVFPLCKGLFLFEEIMKFDPLVKVVENKLVKLSDDSEMSTENLNIVQVDGIESASVPAAGIITAVV